MTEPLNPFSCPLLLPSSSNGPIAFDVFLKLKSRKHKMMHDGYLCRNNTTAIISTTPAIDNQIG
ncbi:MAG: hypothetical protein WBE61_11440 [Nitrososphaeraceae archaeon]